MSTEAKKDQSGTVQATKRYHRPSLEDYGDARDLTRSNVGVGGDGAIFDNVDSGLDGAGTAS